MTDHECVFVEEQEPSGRLVLPPCLVCGITAMDALGEVKRERDEESLKINDWIERYTNACQHLERNAATWLKRERQLEALIRRAAPFVNAVAVMADNRTPSLAWLADAAPDHTTPCDQCDRPATRSLVSEGSRWNFCDEHGAGRADDQAAL